MKALINFHFKNKINLPEFQFHRKIQLPLRLKFDMPKNGQINYARNRNV